jgi:hypothetical protein
MHPNGGQGASFWRVRRPIWKANLPLF